MNSKRLFSFILALVSFSCLMPINAYADDSKDFEDVPKDKVVITRVAEKTEVCGFSLPEEEIYSSELVAIRRKLQVENGEIFRVKVFIKNTGTMPWFSNDSECLGPKMSLGTDKERDRESIFYAETLEGVENTNWEGANRVGMDQLRIDPGKIASFTFFSKAPEEEDVVKEYFTPVLKDLAWLDDSGFYFEMIIGEINESASDLRKKLSYSDSSGSVLDINLDGEKLILVDLSEQQMYVYLDDDVIRQFPVSSGAAATPTPTGTTEITLKQEVRVGNKHPYYIMPYFQWFRAGGYGFHALPSLGGDGGIFWTEALEHIGIPVSHGCVRLLPDDAEWLYNFTEIGTTVTVQY